MNINRHNYEEFFILYLDNELSSGDRDQVESFARQHPDLQEELSMLQQSRLVPDAAIVFTDKESLMKSGLNDFITHDNYEEWLVLYIDNELTTEQKISVETFVVANPSIKKELELLQQIKLQPDVIIFTDKQSLYRKEETTRRIVPIRWWQVAAVIILILGLTIGGFSIFTNKSKPVKLARNETKGQKATQPNTPVKTPAENRQDNTSLAVTASDQDPQNKKQPITAEVIITKNNKRTDRLKEKIKEEEEAFANSTEKNKNDLPEPAYNPNMKGNIETNDRIIAYVPNKEALTNQKEFKLTSNVTPDIDRTLQTTDSEIADGKKNKFRGLLRKITRTFEKTTNIKATDEDDRLLVAGLAIKL